MYRDPSDPSFVQLQDAGIDTVVGGEKIACDRRLPRKNPVRYSLLSDDVRAALPETAFDLSFPVTSDAFLDLDFVRAELGKSTKSLGTIVVSRSTLREMMRGLDDPVGHLVRVFGQLRNPKTFDAKSAFAKNSAPVSENHSFAFSPVVIATTGEGQGDQGEIAYQGVVVSNKCVNYAVGDPRRKSLGRNPVFEESVCAVLVTHVYNPPISYAEIGPHATKKRGDAYDIVEHPHRNAFDSVFLWNEFMRGRRDQRGCGVSAFGFTDTKQSGKDVVRQLFPWSLVHAHRTLDEFRRRDDLRRFLLETPMTLAGKRAAARKECPSGIDVRRFLLAELLLKNTPLEPLLVGQPPIFEFSSPLATV
jgi:hypothetical protein